MKNRKSQRVQALGIAELAKLGGVTNRTVRYYVSEGLLPPPGGSGSARVYGHEHYVRLRLIKRLQEEHLPLEEIKERLAALSLRQMEEFLESAPPRRKRVSAQRMLTAILNSPEEAAAQGADGIMLRQMVPAEPPGAAEGAASAGSTAEQISVQSAAPWRRVTIAPGVELHYQLSEDPRLAAAIEKIIAAAVTALEEASRPDSSGNEGRGRKRGDSRAGGASKKSWFHRSEREAESEDSRKDQK